MRKIIFIILLSIVFFANSKTTKKNITSSENAIRKRIVLKAINFIGPKRPSLKVGKKSFRFDCSGFVMACYYSTGIDLYKKITPAFRSPDIAKSIYNNFKYKSWKNPLKKTPKPGDLVFFDNTYDRNKNHKWDDRITHIAIVEKVDPDKTIHIIHKTSRGITRYVMNFKYKTTYKIKNKKINDYLRFRPKTSKLPKPNYFAVNLCCGFISIF